MPRAEFNVEAVVTSGLKGVPPLTVKGIALGRLVPQIQVGFDGQFPSRFVFWFTTESTLISAGPWYAVFAVESIDLDECDRLDFPTLGVYGLIACIRQHVIPSNGLPYNRFLMAFF